MDIEFNLDAMVEDTRAWARQQGMDLDTLLGRAAKHFTDPELKPLSRPLTDEELEALVEDDNEAFRE